MRVELFYFAGCPNWTVAEDRLTEALLTVGRDDITLERNKVDTPAAARAAGFTGSPTIRIDDRDPVRHRRAGGSVLPGLLHSRRSQRVTDRRSVHRGVVMKRIILIVLGPYLLIAVANKAAEAAGAMTFGCADGCWCKRPGLNVFRWVFPWGHRSAHPAHEKAELDHTES